MEADLQGEDGRIRAELDEKYAEIWAIYVDGWKGGANTPLDSTLFRQLMSSDAIVREALGLDRYPLVKRQLEQCASRLRLTAESAQTEPGLVAIAAAYAPQVLELPVLLAGLAVLDNGEDSAVAAKSYFTAALSKGRPQAYEFMRRAFTDVPNNASVHPRLLLTAAEENLLLDPSWVVSLVRNTPIALRESVIAVLLTAIRRGWDDDVAREVLVGYLDVLDEKQQGTPTAPLAETAPATTMAVSVPGDVIAPQPIAGGTVLLGIAIGERHFTVSEVRWMGSDNISELLNFEVWCSTLTVLNGGIPTDVPPIPGDFIPALYTYEALAPISADALQNALTSRAVVIALVPFAGTMLSPDAAQEKFNTVHRHTVEHFLEDE